MNGAFLASSTVSLQNLGFEEGVYANWCLQAKSAPAPGVVLRLMFFRSPLAILSLLFYA